MTLTADVVRSLTIYELHEFAYRYVTGKSVRCPDDGTEMDIFLTGEELATAALAFRCPRCGACGEYTRDM